MCGAIPTPCEICGVFWRIERLCEFPNCGGEDE